MSKVISSLKGFAIEATDGRIGTVVDFLFDDASWKVRWLVVDCGSWLTGRKVLIHPPAVSYAGIEDQQFQVSLTKAQVESGPPLLEHQPISLQMESRSYEYYGWDSQWGTSYLGGIPGAMASPVMAPPYLGVQMRDEQRTHVAAPEEGDPHLRSVVETIGYHIHAIDGEIGHVQDFMLDDDWSLNYFIVDTSNWWFGKRVLLATHAMKAIDFVVREVRLDLRREQIKACAPWNPLVAFETYRKHLDKHYGWPGSRA